MAEYDREPTTFEKLKLLYHSARLVFFDDEKLIGKHITDNVDKKEFLSYILEGLFSKYRHIPEIHVGYSHHGHGDKKELCLDTSIKLNWEKTLFGEIKEKGCSGNGYTSTPLQQCSGEDNEEILLNNLENIAQTIYDQTLYDKDNPPVKYQLNNGGGKEPYLDLDESPRGEEFIPVKYKGLNPLPAPAFSTLEKQLKKLVKTKAKRSWEK